MLDSSQALTPVSLLTFLVSNMEPRHRLALALDMCSEECRTLVLQQAALATTNLHHRINHATLRLHHLLAQLVRVLSLHPTNVGSNPQYRILHYTKLHLARELRVLRLKLHHIDHIKKLLTQSSEEEMPNNVALFESFQYLIQKTSYSPEEQQGPSIFHDEL